MIDIALATIQSLSVHHVGNKNNGDPLLISQNEITIGDTLFQDKLLSFFLGSLPTHEQLRFTNAQNDFTENALYNWCKELFSGKNNFHTISVHIAKHLYDVSMHPQIKSGDLFVVHLKNISYNGETVHGLGIFKSENKHSFIQVHTEDKQAAVYLLEGIHLEKLDKGALILNTEAGDGYRVCILDRSNKNTEAEFWKNNFLQLAPCNDEFQQTKQMLEIAKTYVTTQFTEDFEVEKPEQIEMMHRSIEYFKTRESFDNKEFEREVLSAPTVIESFRNFKDHFVQDNNIELEDSFEISDTAVKKQQKFFKSVIKLDKNFHIYVHGNRELIEQGTDPDGKKYYKIYYKEES